MNIIETISQKGIKSTSGDGLVRLRLEKPRSGDLVQWKDNTYGRIWEAGFGHCHEHQLQVCRDLGSAFMDESGIADISGGPFYIITFDDLEPTYRLHYSTFWNWGDNTAGAHKGVHFQIARPVFRHIGPQDLGAHST